MWRNSKPKLGDWARMQMPKSKSRFFFLEKETVSRQEPSKKDQTKT